jgi:hypothetical protein
MAREVGEDANPRLPLGIRKLLVIGGQGKSTVSRIKVEPGLADITQF